MRFLAALPLLLLAPAATDASAQTGCTRSVVKVALADGKEMPHVIVECPGAESQGLLAADAIEKACAGAGDPTSLAACQRSVANAQQALRQAKIRAALREGVPDEEIEEAFGAEPGELDALRPSADLTRPATSD